MNITRRENLLRMGFSELQRLKNHPSVAVPIFYYLAKTETSADKQNFFHAVAYIAGGNQVPRKVLDDWNSSSAIRADIDLTDVCRVYREVIDKSKRKTKRPNPSL